MASPTPSSGLTVRQHEREGVEVPVEFVLKSAHASQVKFSASSVAFNASIVQAQAMDISSGGVGVRSRVFIPRMCEGTIRVFIPSMSGAEPKLMFEHDVKVRRVFLIGREPTYSVGMAFLNPTPELDDQISQLFDCLNELKLSKRSTVAAGESHA